MDTKMPSKIGLYQKKVVILTLQQDTHVIMKRFAAGLVILLSSIYNSGAQAPLPPNQSENSLSRIDSLTMQFYREIPSHKPLLNNGFEFNEKDFTDNFAQLGSEIPFEYHNLVRQQIQYFMALPDAYFDRIHQRMSLYFPIFEEILDKNSMPTELKYVSVIESALNPNAVSWCGATGLWQFMPYTGKLMGMKINYSVDERKSIMASTEKACEYFQNSQNIFDNWLLSIASYNCGAGNVMKAMRRAGGKTKDFWAILKYLPKETQYYVPKFIAAAYVLNFTKHAKRDKYNSISEVLIPTRVDTSFHLVKMCNYIAGPDQEDLLKLNREFIKPNTQLATNNTILLPYQYSMCYWRDNDSLIQNTLLSSYEVVSSQNASKHYSGSNSKPKKTVTTATGQSKTVHVVRSGETISSIARKYGTSVDKIMQMNNLHNSRIGVGQRLIVKNGQNHQRNYR